MFFRKVYLRDPLNLLKMKGYFYNEFGVGFLEKLFDRKGAKRLRKGHKK